MRKKIISFILLICFFLHSTPVYAEYSEKYENSLYFQMDRSNYVKNGTYGEIGEWIESGNFYYEILNDEKGKLSRNYITIRRVKEAALKNGVLEIPDEIDGYPVLGVGVFAVEPYPYLPGEVTTGKGGILENPVLLKKVVFAEGIEAIGMSSFEGCVNLKQVVFPQSLVYIAPGAFFDSREISELSFPQGAVVGNAQSFSPELLPAQVTFYSNCFLNFQLCNNPLAQNKTEAYLYYYQKKHFNYPMTGYLKKLFIDPKITSLHMQLLWEDGIPFLCGIKELVINGKNTKLNMDDEINSFYISGIYTVKGANAIKEAKKHGIPYFVKKTGKIQVVKAKKKTGQYKASWEKVKTKVERHRDYNNWKGKLLKKAVKTKYKIYGRSQKSDSYKKICTTVKTSIKSRYKYIKVVPVKEWE